ncbi:MAG: TIGR04438 family Trp-rich protein [Burkholderiaceae bacterium]|nr:TIGR04438 family Trp-rich protein [Burkholderiaceae bacterium]
MAFLLLGLALLALKFAEIGPVAQWSWWVVLAPFGLAVAWWAYADSTGLTQRRAIAKMDKRKAERRQRDMEALGLGIQRDKRTRRAPAASAASARPAAPRPAAAPSPAPAPPSRFEDEPVATRRDPEL